MRSWILVILAIWSSAVAAVSDGDLMKAENIVKSFLSQVDNVDYEENVWFVVKVVADIEPVDSRRKVLFLLTTCRSYDPTDKPWAHYVACQKVYSIGRRLAPGVKASELTSEKSPLLEIVGGN